MSDRTYHRTTYSFAVLSEGPIDPNTELETILRECTDGDLLLDWAYTPEPVVVNLTAQEMAKAAVAAGSDAGFFGLDDDGNSADVINELTEDQIRNALGR